MALTFTTPGVFVQELSTLPPSVAGVSTGVPAFIGYTRTGTTTPPSAVRITSMIEFEQNFGLPLDETITVTVDDTVVSSVLQNRSIVVTISPSGRNLYYSMQMY